MPDGGVDRPLTDVVVEPDPPPTPPVVVDDTVLLGEISGENTAPSAYSERFRPYCLARFRLTSRISTSTTISARGLSFCAIIRSRIWATAVDARTVMVLLALFTWMIGCTGMPGSLLMALRICAMSVASACDR